MYSISMLFGSCKHNNLFTEYTKKRQHDKHDPCYMQCVKSYSMISNTFLLEFQKKRNSYQPLAAPARYCTSSFKNVDSPCNVLALIAAFKFPHLLHSALCTGTCVLSFGLRHVNGSLMRRAAHSQHHIM